MNMTNNEDPTEVYKSIIDQLVEKSKSMHGRLVVDEGIYSKAPSHSSYNAFVKSLNENQKQLLASMLDSERSSAIHDVLAVFTWWIDCKNVAWTYKDKKMDMQLSEMGLHGDYMGRLGDWDWPD